VNEGLAFQPFSTVTQDLTGDNAIRQGCDEEYVFTVADANGPVNISEYTARCEVRTAVGGTKVGLPQPTMSLLNGGTGGEILMEFANADTAGKTLAGRFDIELVHTSTSKVTRPFEGATNMKTEVTTGASP
jgi:hypothetical protein